MVKNYVSRAWKLKGEMQMTIHGDSIYVFEFDSADDRIRAIEFGPVFVANQLFLVRPWHESIEQELTELKSVPTWVNLRRVPLHMWNAACLSKIASLIGKPIMMDHLTLTKSRMSFARVLVEVDITCDYPASVPVYYKGKHVVDVEVEYSWKPQVCSECSCFGHTLSKCPKIKAKEVLVPAVEQVKSSTTTGEHQQWVVKGSKKTGNKLVIDVGKNSKPLLVQDNMEEETLSPGRNKENMNMEVESGVGISTENMFDVLIEEEGGKQQEVVGPVKILVQNFNAGVENQSRYYFN